MLLFLDRLVVFLSFLDSDSLFGALILGAHLALEIEAFTAAALHTADSGSDGCDDHGDAQDDRDDYPGRVLGLQALLLCLVKFIHDHINGVVNLVYNDRDALLRLRIVLQSFDDRLGDVVCLFLSVKTAIVDDILQIGTFLGKSLPE